MTGHDYFRALLEVATVINSSLEPTVVLHKITEQTAKAMNCKASTLRLLDRTGKLLLASADGVLRTVRTQEQRTRTVADRAGGTWRAAGESQGTGLQPRKLINRIIHTFQSTDHHAPLAANTPDATPFT